MVTFKLPGHKTQAVKLIALQTAINLRDTIEFLVSMYEQNEGQTAMDYADVDLVVADLSEILGSLFDVLDGIWHEDSRKYADHIACLALEHAIASSLAHKEQHDA